MISLAYILLNEEKYIERSINSVKDIVSEIVIVDAFSNDNTVGICKKFNSKITQEKWKNDFSYTKNIMISKCSYPWILCLDADEHLENENINLIKHAISESEKNSIVAWSFPRMNHYPSHDSDSPYFSPPFYPDFQVRLFQNRKEIFYSGRVHEGVVQSIETSGIGGIGRLSVHIHHHMFRGDQEKFEKVKNEYYSRLEKGEVHAE